MLDAYRRNVIRKQNEIARLQQDKAKEQKKIANISIKINSAQQAISRSKSDSTIRTKLREIERLQKDLANTEKKIAELETKLSGKNKELINEQGKVSKEEEKALKKRAQESERIRKKQEDNLKRIGSTLTNHEKTHREIKSDLEKLKQLPEKVVVLFLAANPKDAGQLRLDEEARAITEMVRKSKHRDSVIFETRWAVQPMDVLQAINELNPTIVHFSGHGSDADEIVFQDSQGNAKLVSKEAIVQTMMASTSDLRLVFFNTCFSFNQAEAVVQHIEAAIGMNTSIGDEAARIFASQFYSAIGFGLSLNKAFNQAKALMMMEGLNEENTPELFIQSGLNSDELIIVRPEES
ncbi:CHAT domain-containing protein [Vibrio cortegadensis]|uniref:CHAT domain-containing protein n=1 Tax=Vibrio cortegadensis TaxID=1328770 RepID=UPI00352EC621